jgi:hypothetical protein
MKTPAVKTCHTCYFKSNNKCILDQPTFWHKKITGREYKYTLCPVRRRCTCLGTLRKIPAMMDELGFQYIRLLLKGNDFMLEWRKEKGYFLNRIDRKGEKIFEPIYFESYRLIHSFLKKLYPSVNKFKWMTIKLEKDNGHDI